MPGRGCPAYVENMPTLAWAWHPKYKKIKLLGSGDLKQKLDIEVNSISKSAREKIEKLGGKVILIK